jgi:membrane-associated phospholipid phosphatase
MLGRNRMLPITVPPSRPDIAIARAIVRNTTPPTERVASIATWAADEHIVCGVVLGWWLWCRSKPQPERLASDHLLATTVTAFLVPHLLKSTFNQERPDRLTAIGHLRGIPFSGNEMDAFPSGHAIQVGALASAANRLPARQRWLVRTLATGLAGTRVLLLAHWTSDVVAGLAIGAGLERLIRHLTGYGRGRLPAE